MKKAKITKANRIYEHEQQIIGNLRAMNPDVAIVDVDESGVRTAHELVEIEQVVPGKARFVCSCGEVGIPVGCAVFPGVEWATLAHEYHAKLNAEGDHVHA